jgi:hypothetical protein
VAFIPFRIEKDLGGGRVRLKRVKESFFDTEEKLFALPDIVDDENGPYADLLDHLTRCRVKMLNDLIEFESKLTVDEVEDELREAQNADFIEGIAIHTFNELNAILDYMPAGYEGDDDAPAKDIDADEDEDLPDLDEEEEEKLKNDESLKWDDDEEGEEDSDKEEDDKDDEEDEDSDDDEEEDERPRGRRKR